MAESCPCARCGKRPARSRRLCDHCRHWAARQHQLWRWPRTTHSRDEVLSDVAALRPVGLTQREMADRIGMSLTALRRALLRSTAHPQGYPQASTPNTQGKRTDGPQGTRDTVGSEEAA